MTKRGNDTNEPHIGDRVEVWGGYVIEPCGRVNHRSPWKRIRMWVEVIEVQNGDLVLTGTNQAAAKRFTVAKWDPETSRVIQRVKQEVGR